MGSIQERKCLHGSSFRVRLRRQHYQEFTITFDDYETACDWLMKNEQKFYENPEKYFNWKRVFYTQMVIDRRKKHHNMLKSKNLRVKTPEEMEEEKENIEI